MKKIITKLNNNFKIYNKISKLNTRLNNLKFNIKIIDKKKIFKVFYVRFNIIIILLNFLKRLLKSLILYN